MAHSTNSFTVNVMPGAKKFMLLEMTDFKPDAQYNLEPANSEILVNASDRNSKHAGNDAWRVKRDAEKAKQRGENPLPPDTNNTGKVFDFEQPSEPKKLSLSEKLRTALATTNASKPWDAEYLAQDN